MSNLHYGFIKYCEAFEKTLNMNDNDKKLKAANKVYIEKIKQLKEELKHLESLQ